MPVCTPTSPMICDVSFLHGLKYSDIVVALLSTNPLQPSNTLTPFMYSPATQPWSSFCPNSPVTFTGFHPNRFKLVDYSPSIGHVELRSLESEPDRITCPGTVVTVVEDVARHNPSRSMTGHEKGGEWFRNSYDPNAPPKSSASAVISRKRGALRAYVPSAVSFPRGWFRVYDNHSLADR